VKNNFEHAPAQEVERTYESLSDGEKFQIVLGLFGTPAARENFIDLCKNYLEAQNEQMVASNSEESYRKGKNSVSYSSPHRAKFHNKIMATLHGLALQKLKPIQEKVLFPMHDREVAAGIIAAGISEMGGGDFKNEAPSHPSPDQIDFWHDKKVLPEEEIF
jgi:hypothetical protein